MNPNPQNTTPAKVAHAAAFLASILDDHTTATGRVHKNCESALLALTEKAQQAEELEAKVLRLETEIKALKDNGTA